MIREYFVEEKTCRICKGELEELLDLGSIYPSGFIKPEEIVGKDKLAPLVLVRCKDCGLVQLKHTVDLDLMYRQYWYSSSLNKSMVSSLQDIVNDIESKIILKDDDVVIDIGCNDGTMLDQYLNTNLIKIGYDPALNIKPLREDMGIVFVQDYFNASSPYKAKVITAIAMFYDLKDPTKFVQDIIQTLDKEGIFVIQYTDLLSMLKVNAFDNICHEHLEYYSFEVVKNLLENNGLQVIDVSHNNVNGASIRITAAFPGVYKVSPLVENELALERATLNSKLINDFVFSIDLTKAKVTSFLKWAKFHKHRVYIMGASTKGNTLLQVCGITEQDCPYASEVNKEKFGLRTIGSNIEIISEEASLVKHPDYMIVLPWHFKESLITKPAIVDYLKSGGHLIFPLPRFTVVTNTGEYEL